DPHVVVTVDKDVGDGGVIEQRLDHLPRAVHLREYVQEGPPGRFPVRRRLTDRRRDLRPGEDPFTSLIDDAHAWTAPSPSSALRAARSSGPRRWSPGVRPRSNPAGRERSARM